ncbi:MAG: hypothetical protein K2W78_01350 [Xanthobacteraceae bacterium]|nr:hypothetical protein [Xanthobacteraceae bacterium]
MSFQIAPLNIEDFLFQQLNDSRSCWSIGTFGAIAEFSRVGEEEIVISQRRETISAVTKRGGISIETFEGFRPLASESVAWQGWSHRLSLCLSGAEAAMNGRSVLTELSADGNALRPEDRGDILFDLGLAAPHVDFCIRVKDGRLGDYLRRYVGKPLYETGNPALSAILESGPHRVFISRLGRIEVFQTIPRHGEKSPEGPHTHVLPQLLKQGRTHSATEPVPDGLIPCAHVYPWHPADVSLGKTPLFDAAQHRYFQAVLRLFGDERAIAIKNRVIASVMAECGPPVKCFAQSRFDRASIRIALRQMRAANYQSKVLARWLAAYDRLYDEEIDAASTPDLCMPGRKGVSEAV